MVERDTIDPPEPNAEDEPKAPIPKVSMSSRVSLPKISIPREDMPRRAPAAGEDSDILPKKIPTLKIKLGRMDSPVSVGSDETEFKSKKHRRGSLERAKSKEERKSSVDDEDATLQKVPKLKIKLGQPPPSKSPEVETMEIWTMKLMLWTIFRIQPREISILPIPYPRVFQVHIQSTWKIFKCKALLRNIFTNMSIIIRPLRPMLPRVCRQRPRSQLHLNTSCYHSR